MRRRVANRIFTQGNDYENGANRDQWLEMNEVMSIVAYWKKYSIVVYMRDDGAGLNRTYFFIYDQAEDHVTHVTHSHPTFWLSPPPRSITLHYIQNVHFQSYSYKFRTCLAEIYRAVRKHMCFDRNYLRTTCEASDSRLPPILDLYKFLVKLLDGNLNELGVITFATDGERLGDILDGRELLDDSRVFSRLPERIELKDDGLHVTFGKSADAPFQLMSFDDLLPLNSMSTTLRVNEQHYETILAENVGDSDTGATLQERIDDVVKRKCIEYDTFEEEYFLECKGPIPTKIDFNSDHSSVVSDLIASYQGILFQHMAQQCVVFLFENTPMVQNQKTWDERECPIQQARQQELSQALERRREVTLDGSDDSSEEDEASGRSGEPMHENQSEDNGANEGVGVFLLFAQPLCLIDHPSCSIQ